MTTNDSWGWSDRGGNSEMRYRGCFVFRLIQFREESEPHATESIPLRASSHDIRGTIIRDVGVHWP